MIHLKRLQKHYSYTPQVKIEYNNLHGLYLVCIDGEILQGVEAGASYLGTLTKIIEIVDSYEEK